ncbi:MAG: hypothetical protein V3W09_04770 [Nitrososphaerales archaeon]
MTGIDCINVATKYDWRPFLAERGYLHEEEQAKIKMRMWELEVRAKEKGIKIDWPY